MLASWPHRLHCIAGHIWLHAPHAPLIKSQDYDKALRLAEAAGQQPDPYVLLSSRMLRLCDLMSLQDYDEALRLAEAAGQQPDPYVLNSRGNCRASLGEGWLQLQLWPPVLSCDNSNPLCSPLRCASLLAQSWCPIPAWLPGAAAWAAVALLRGTGVRSGNPAWDAGEWRAARADYLASAALFQVGWAWLLKVLSW